jgi:Outer membrane protein beta-barrel domain
MLKKLAIGFIFCCLVVPSALAQNGRFGIRGGLNISSVNINLAGLGVNSSNRIGYHLGVVYETSISEKILFQPALLYSVKGLSDSGNTGGGTTVPSSEGFNYIEVPLNVMYLASEKLSMGGGPYLGYLMGYTNDVLTGDERRFDYGLNLAMAYEISEGLQLSANYALGLSNMFKTDPATSLGFDVSLSNRNIGLSVTKFF